MTYLGVMRKVLTKKNVKALIKACDDPDELELDRTLASMFIKIGDKYNLISNFEDLEEAAGFIHEMRMEYGYKNALSRLYLSTLLEEIDEV